MTVQDVIDRNLFTIVTTGRTDKEIKTPFCCDLLSIAMSKAPAGAAWVTIMGNVNTLAVASLTDSACIILAEGITLDSAIVEKAKAEEITILSTDKPIFEAAFSVYELLNACSQL